MGENDVFFPNEKIKKRILKNDIFFNLRDTIKDVHVLNFWTFTFNLENDGMFMIFLDRSLHFFIFNDVHMCNT